MNLSAKNKQIQRHREQTCCCKGSGGEEELGVWASGYKLLYVEWIDNKVRLYSMGNYIQYPIINHNVKGYERECMQMYN